eukprot:5912160-Pleurochrysis_carterae.AAC.1
MPSYTMMPAARRCWRLPVARLAGNALAQATKAANYHAYHVESRSRQYIRATYHSTNVVLTRYSPALSTKYSLSTQMSAGLAYTSSHGTYRSKFFVGWRLSDGICMSTSGLAGRSE